jgi:hypothetical protein
VLAFVVSARRHALAGHPQHHFQAPVETWD